MRCRNLPVFRSNVLPVPIPVAERSQTRVCDARLLGLWVLIRPGVCLALVSVVCCQVEVSETGRSLVQRGLSECGMSLCEATLACVRLLRPQKERKYCLCLLPCSCSQCVPSTWNRTLQIRQQLSRAMHSHIKICHASQASHFTNIKIMYSPLFMKLEG